MPVVIHRVWGVCDLVTPASEPVPPDLVLVPYRTHRARRKVHKGLNRNQVTWALDRTEKRQTHAFVARRGQGGTVRWVCVDHYFFRPRVRTRVKWRFPRQTLVSKRRSLARLLDVCVLAWVFCFPDPICPWPLHAQADIETHDDRFQLDTGQWIGAAMAWKSMAPLSVLKTLRLASLEETVRYARPWTALQHRFWATSLPWFRTVPSSESETLPVTRVMDPGFRVTHTVRVRSDTTMQDPLARVWQTLADRPYGQHRFGPYDALLPNRSAASLYGLSRSFVRGVVRYYAVWMDLVSLRSRIVSIPESWKAWALSLHG